VKQPKFRIGNKVSTKDGLLFGTIGSIREDNGFHYSLKEDIEGNWIPEESLIQLDVVDENDAILEKYFGPVDKNTVDEIKKHMNPDIVDEIESRIVEESKKFKFELGDVVKVSGYDSLFVVTGYDYAVDGYIVVQYLLEDISDECIAFEEDMVKAELDEIIDYEDSGIIPKEVEPTDKKLKSDSENYKRPHRSREKKTIAKLELNRAFIEELKRQQDWYLDMYNFTGDQKYLRRVKRLQGWIEKIPTRAYQIKEEL
jgi:hypothetical protein